jgi:hypothetical protein
MAMMPPVDVPPMLFVGQSDSFKHEGHLQIKVVARLKWCMVVLRSPSKPLLFECYVLHKVVEYH